MSYVPPLSCRIGGLPAQTFHAFLLTPTAIFSYDVPRNPLSNFRPHCRSWSQVQDGFLVRFFFPLSPQLTPFLPDFTLAGYSHFSSPWRLIGFTNDYVARGRDFFRLPALSVVFSPL